MDRLEDNIEVVEDSIEQVENSTVEDSIDKSED